MMVYEEAMGKKQRSACVRAVKREREKKEKKKKEKEKRGEMV